MHELSLSIPDEIRDIVREPNWYDHLSAIKGSLALGVFAARQTDAVHLDRKLPAAVGRLLQRVFAQLLKEDAVTLADAGPNWDGDRQAIDTIVVHHTSRVRPMALELLNAIHLLNLYVPKYQNPGEDLEIIGGMPIYSGHANNAGKQVFYGYHWLIRHDGSRERLLPDAAIGWHAGNWEVNRRSVAVCFDGDFAQGQPSREALDSVAELIVGQYGAIASASIVGHKAITKTTCPGNSFDIWGEELRALVDANRAAA